MECTLATLAACLSLSNVYIDSSLVAWDQELVFDNRAMATDDYNPHGRLAIGFSVPFERITLTLEASHMSSLATGEDRGINAVSVGVRWYPFR